MIGQTLGHYKIEEQLGAGGMGVVYRAADSKLGRQVAIKVLPESYARDPERLARFEREARLLAALNHPNIASIHGLEEAGGVRYLVLELVPGLTLAQRLASGPLPVQEALQVCRQIAEALEAAHEKGIIHRDLKPANVKITPEGKVKVLDFGLAKTFESGSSSPDLSQSPTVSIEGTREGVVLGTAGYMSPEQARGAAVDKRTDVWALGGVLFEVLAGRRVFPGETFSDCMAAVLTRGPGWEALPQSTPPNVRALVHRCLQKDPQKRLRDAGDACLEIEEALAGPPSAALVEPVSRRAPQLRALRYAAGGLLGGVLVAGLIGWQVWRKPPVPPAVARFTITLGPDEIFPTGGAGFAFSPDGSRLVYAVQKGGQRQIYVRAMNEFQVQPIPATESMMPMPSFSPDGQWMAFRQGPKWKKVALGGGPPVTMFDAPQGGAAYASWGADNTLVFGLYPAGMGRMPASGGKLQEVPVVDPSKDERWGGFPQFLPAGKAVMYGFRTKDTDSYDDYNIGVFSFETGKRKTLIEGGRNAQYLSTGHVVYIRGGAVYAAPFDVGQLTVTGPSVMVQEGVYQSNTMDGFLWAVSANGSLAYAPGGPVGGGRKVVWVDRQGKVEPLPLPPRAYLHPRISPDARQIAIETEGPNHNVYLYDLERGTLTKMTFDGSSHWPVWTPDGKRLTYRVGMPGPFKMWWAPADRSGAAEQLTTVGEQQSAASWSPDGRVLAFTQVSAETGGDVYTLEVNGERQPRPFSQSKFDEASPRFSPDGRWIAYCSNESGQNEIYVQAYPGPGPKILISTEGGSDPTWKRTGGELYYRSGDKMMAVTVGTGPAFTAGKPRLLWERHYNQGTNSMCGAPGPSSSNYDVTSDGQRFLMIQEGDQDAPATEIRVVVNWVEELKRLLAERRKS